MKKKILITGVAGFIGSYVQDRFIKQGHTVLGIDNLIGGFKRNINPDCEWYSIDLNDSNNINKIVEKFRPEILIHIAASAEEGASFFDPVRITRNNLMGYMIVLEACIKAGSLEFVSLYSSMSVYGNQLTPFMEDTLLMPIDIYASNKVAMEQITCQMSECHNFKYSIIIPHNVFSARQCIRDKFRNVIGIMMNRIMRNETLYIYGDGEQTRQFSNIRDSLPCFVKMVNEMYHTQRVNIGGLQIITINEIVKMVTKEFESSYPIPKITHLSKRFQEVTHAWCNANKSIKLLGYKENYGIQQGIKEMANWAIKLGAQNWNDRKLPIFSNYWPLPWR